jgi:hypothetical protein
MLEDDEVFMAEELTSIGFRSIKVLVKDQPAFGKGEKFPLPRCKD